MFLHGAVSLVAKPRVVIPLSRVRFSYRTPTQKTASITLSIIIDMYPTVEHVKLTLVFSVDYESMPPMLEIKNNEHTILSNIEIASNQEFTFDLALPNDHCESGSLEIIRSNFDGSSHQNLTLDRIYLDGINLNKICYQARYYPVYPEPWISEQTAMGKHWPEYLTGVSSWGWNGRCVLDYETPIYTWLLKNV